MPGVPKFKNEDEEREFWATHDATEYTADNEQTIAMEFVDRRKKAVTLRMDPQLKQDLVIIAKRKGIGYQTLMQMWLKERVAKEQA